VRLPAIHRARLHCLSAWLPIALNSMRGRSRNGTSLATLYVFSSRRSLPDCYKIKLRSSGYRLIYQVVDKEVVVFVVAVDKRERGQAYRKAAERL